MLRSLPLKAALWLLPLAACGGEETVERPTATLANIQQHIFSPGCANSGCHDAETKGGELDLSSTGASYLGMIRVPAKNRVARANRWVLVEPGSTGKSFLIRKMVAPGPGEGDPMPSAAEELNPFWLELIEEWIEQGAPQ